MYRVVQVLNNNIAIVKKNHEQAIAMGKGLVFQKKKGDLLSEDSIQNLFVLKSEESKQNFSFLLKDVPLDFITTAYEIIENAVTRYHYSVQEYIYVTLTDHIYWNYKRLIKGEYQNSLLPDISKQYPKEYQIAKDGLRIIKERLDIAFPEDELKNISIHFINAQGKTPEPAAIPADTYDEQQRVMQILEEALRKRNIVRTEKTQNFYDRLMIHLRYMLERTEEEKVDEFALKMEEDLKKDYPKAYSVAEEMYRIINENTGLKLNASEKVYFTIHIQRLL
ncbi:PRD domain-containing protein [Enterococcus hulanensis]|uniref:PRD domain-containing protein n=1 Tax=Enterococcus hulanensis TaxID=2559929 RepID=A0ABU3EU28_9ENTE|nr:MULTISPECIES: PRD domain-containing protein [Enterococcus]MBO0459741.1 PRD domain-containing protein [Enterococcus hulanensis]MBX8936743.1 PRD domain-containing protein [Enterococcus gilvus]MDT2598343.1 PRD domain-containing protein [Enterococcus hulanensis]MDT2608152.1 PRD domain-containing protein [Enterococcus hulanensis]MDT2615447.1 PRD domain-containing protein [Enterococcus hulanensis]